MRALAGKNKYSFAFTVERTLAYHGVGAAASIRQSVKRLQQLGAVVRYHRGAMLKVGTRRRQRIGHIHERKLWPRLKVLTQLPGLSSQRCLSLRGEQQRNNVCVCWTGGGLRPGWMRGREGGGLFEDEVGVGAGDAEARDGGAAGAAVRSPGLGSWKRRTVPGDQSMCGEGLSA